MNTNKLFVSISFVILIAASSNASSNEILKKAEFLQVTRYMMMQPCNIPSYISCLGIKKSFCENSVNGAIKACNANVNIPKSIPRKDAQQLINAYGNCVTVEISSRLKLTQTKLQQCESVLRAGLEKKK